MLLAVAMIVVLFVLYGMTLAALTARLERAYPQLEKKSRSLITYAPLLLLALPPFPIVVVGAVVLGVLQDRLRAVSWRPALVHRIGAIVVGAAVVAGNVWLSFGIADILA